MNHKTIRAYQFKADEAVRTLEEAGAQWVVGKGKPHWVMPVQDTVDVEEIKKQARKEFLDEIMAIGKPKEDPKAIDCFELGPQVFPNRHEYLDKFATIRKLPSWHKLSTAYVGSTIQVIDISFISRSRYKGYCAVFKIGTATAWLPLSCIKFKL